MARLGSVFDLDLWCKPEVISPPPAPRGSRLSRR